MNLDEFSRQNNIELGVAFARKEDKNSYFKVVDEFLNVMQDKRSEVPVDKLDDKEARQFEKALNGSWF